MAVNSSRFLSYKVADQKKENLSFPTFTLTVSLRIKSYWLSSGKCTPAHTHIPHNGENKVQQIFVAWLGKLKRSG